MPSKKGVINCTQKQAIDMVRLSCAFNFLTKPQGAKLLKQEIIANFEMPKAKTESVRLRYFYRAIADKMLWLEFTDHAVLIPNDYEDERIVLKGA